MLLVTPVSLLLGQVKTSETFMSWLLSSKFTQEEARHQMMNVIEKRQWNK